MRNKNTARTDERHSSTPADYVLSIKLPTHLVQAIDREAQSQYRTRASLIREALAERFQKVA